MTTATAERKLTAKDFQVPFPNDWCPGCGDFGIINAVQQAFARLEKAGEGGMHAGRPVGLAAKEGIVAVMDEHDHRRIGARKMHVGFIAGGAEPHMTAVPAYGRLAADAAKPVALVPMDHAPGIGQKRSFRSRHQGADAPQFLETTDLRERGQGVLVQV